MPHTYVSLYVHVIFSTKERRKQIPDEVQPRLWSYMGGIARANRFKAITVGGVDDHAHLLLSLPTTIPIAKAVQLIKAGSSKWMHEEIRRPLFAWQESYGAFSIGVSQIPGTVKYIENQKEHHRRCSFADELALILKKHGMTPED
jgi:putative transposase